MNIVNQVRTSILNILAVHLILSSRRNPSLPSDFFPLRTLTEFACISHLYNFFCMFHQTCHLEYDHTNYIY
jgi:hypothetical protein